MAGFKRRFNRRLARGAALALAAGLMPAAAATVFCSPPAQAADDVTNLLGQVKKQLELSQRQMEESKRQLAQSQREIKALKRQVEILTKRVAQTPGPPPPGVAPGLPRAQAAVPPPPPAAVRPPPAGPEVIAGVQPPGLPPPSAGVHPVEQGSARFGIESADGRNAIFLTGRLHFDLGDYLDYNPASRFASVQDLNSGVNARRARLGIIGRFARDWDYTFIYDFGGSSDGYPPTPGALASGLENALVTYNGLKNRGVPLVFDIGYMDVPFTFLENVASNDIPLLERPAIQNVASNIFANDFRSALGARSFNDRYWAGLYLTGPTSGMNHTTGTPIGTFGRAGYNIWQSPDGFLHLEGDAGALLKPPAPGGIRSITLSDRPEMRVDPTQILSTGVLGSAANPLHDALVYGFGVAAEWRNFVVDGEYYRIDINREGLATNTFDGGYVEGSWVITGEQRKYAPSAGAYLRPVPAHPFSPWDDQWGYGAFELAARYSTINLNDNFTPGIAPPRGSNAVGGGQQTVYSIGLNWYPNANIRFMFDFLHGEINKRFSTAAGGGIPGTPLGTPVGGNFDAFAMRTQVAF